MFVVVGVRAVPPLRGTALVYSLAGAEGGPLAGNSRPLLSVRMRLATWTYYGNVWNTGWERNGKGKREGVLISHQIMIVIMILIMMMMMAMMRMMMIMVMMMLMMILKIIMIG